MPATKIIFVAVAVLFFVAAAFNARNLAGVWQSVGLAFFAVSTVV